MSSFFAEGLHESNFVTTRKPSITTVLELVEVHNSVLIASPPFTGKTSLCTLLIGELQRLSQNFVFVDLVTYHPDREDLSTFFERKCGRKYEDIFTSTHPLYVLIDEWQKIYPSTIDEVTSCYASNNPTSIAASHQQFHFHLKAALRNEALKFICFSSYGSEKIGSSSQTPVQFSFKTSDFAFFKEEEIQELLTDFSQRTQLHWIRSNGVPELLHTFLHEVLSYHVGYVARALSEINMHSLSCKDERSLELLLYSKMMLQALSSQRASPSWQDNLSSNQVNSFKELLRKGGRDNFLNSTDYLFFVRQGWVILRDSEISLPCPYSKEILWNHFFGQTRPHTDPFTCLNEFMRTFLKNLSTSFLIGTLSTSAGGHILEALWCVCVRNDMLCLIFFSMSYIELAIKYCEETLSFMLKLIQLKESLFQGRWIS